MTIEDNSNQGRSKLTLKLKAPAAPSEPNAANAAPINAVTKNTESKRVSNSLVQVTIKGRKKEVKDSDFFRAPPGGLSKSEFESRKLALKNLDSKSDDLDGSQIRLKISKSVAEEEIKNAERNKKEEKIEIVEAKSEEVEKPAEPKPAEPTSTRASTYQYEVDNFDVRNKIKESLAVQNRQKEEREKVLEEKKKLETQKQQEKDNKDKKAKVKPAKIEDLEDEAEKNNKKAKLASIKDPRANSRRLLQTYIVDDEGDFYGRHRKKQKSRLKEIEGTKEYIKITREVILPELISVADLAERMSEKAGDVIKKLFTIGMAATSNQVIDADTAELIIAEFGHVAKRVAASDVENVLGIDIDSNAPKLERAPVVTIMGHVDHGKTSLLDAIRSTNVVSGEAGGITQHIGASRIKTSSGKYITFLDTPGHEAFTEMRSRGANVTDIVVLVVAADDGVKAQTVEAISHAKAAGVPIIVAVNKIDKPGADSSKVKHELLSYEIIAEDLSGDAIFVEVSAKERINLDKLEEAILLQSEVLELKAPYDCAAQGVVIETKVDPARGVIATLLIEKGTLHLSDLIVAGTAYGKVRHMIDDKGKNIKIATPSMPVEALGLDGAPNAGDTFFVVKEEKQARDIIAYRSKKERDDRNLKNSAKSLSDIFKQSGHSKIKYLPIIIKGDVHGSVEAVAGSLVKLNTEEVAIKIVHQATGGITESDVSLASVIGAIIIGFNARANVAAKELARIKNIDIRYHSIIYNVVDELKAMLGGMLEPIKNEEHLGQAEIRQVFKVSGAGKIGGCTVTNGVIKRGAKVRLLRDNVVIHDGALKTLKRFKEDVKEVKQGFECGAALENFDDIKEGDIIECYEIVIKKRSL